jgi:hypothetical protein
MKDGANLAIMSCLEFYEGAALPKAIRDAGQTHRVPVSPRPPAREEKSLHSAPEIE